MQAVILAGGKGTRLGALSGGRPKPLVDIDGHFFILYLIEALRRHGFTDIVLLVGPFATQYRDMLGDGAALGVKLTLVGETSPAGTAGALHYAAPALQPEFLLLNGDSFFDFNFLDLSMLAGRGDFLVTMALREVANAGRYGAVVVENGVVTHFGEKSQSGSGIINGGVYWMKRDALGEIGAPPVSLEGEVLPRLARRGRVAGKVYDGRFIDIGIPEDLARAKRLLPEWVRRPAAFLSRVGALSGELGSANRPADFVWLEGVKEAVKRLNDAGWLVIMIINQAGIARGAYGPGDVDQFDRWINEQMALVGAHIDAFYFCPHQSDDGEGASRRVCDCRNPGSGLLLQAMRELPVRAERSVMIGDEEADMAAARQAGIREILYRGQNLDRLVGEVLVASYGEGAVSG